MSKLRLIEGDSPLKRAARSLSTKKDEKTQDVKGKTDNPKPVAYTNRKGRKYYLFRVETKTGKARYVFRRNIEGDGEPVRKMPEGHEVAESVNGIVSLRKAVESPIRDDELEAVRSVLDKHDHLTRYRVEDVKGDIVVFEPIGGVTPDLVETLRRFNPFFSRPNLETLEQSVRYSPVLRFRLVDKEKRRFYTERMTYRGEGGMMPLMRGSGTIRDVANRFCPKLGRDSFFDLF
jgi:hypothetical protein